MNPRKRTLVFRGGALGDFLLSLPALQSLDLEDLTLVTRPAYSRLLHTCGWEHSAVNLESAHLTPLFQAENLPDCLARWLEEFDEIYAWMTDSDGHFQRNLQAATRANVTLLHPIVAATGPHASQQLATGLGRIIAPIHWPQLPNVAVQTSRLAIHLGSGGRHKNWPVQRWVELMHQVAGRDPEVSFLLIAGEADGEALAEMKAAMEQVSWPLSYAEHLSLSDLVPLLLSCGHYAGHDTGISHLAASIGVPTLALFGPTDPFIWAPLGPHVAVLQAPAGKMGNLCVETVLASLLGAM